MFVFISKTSGQTRTIDLLDVNGNESVLIKKARKDESFIRLAYHAGRMMSLEDMMLLLTGWYWYQLEEKAQGMEFVNIPVDRLTVAMHMADFRVAEVISYIERNREVYKRAAQQVMFSSETDENTIVSVQAARKISFDHLNTEMANAVALRALLRRVTSSIPSHVKHVKLTRRKPLGKIPF